MRLSWRPSRFVVVMAVMCLVLTCTGVWVKLAFYPGPIEDVCRSLGEGHDFSAVPDDVLEKAAKTHDVRLERLAEPTVAQLEAARSELTPDVNRVSDYTACLVDYARTGRDGEPDADVPALLVYRESDAPVSPCFGFDCGEDEPTYTTHCARFTNAATGRLLRLEGCWGDPPRNNFLHIQD